jgi:hypothetical protein
MEKLVCHPNKVKKEEEVFIHPPEVEIFSPDGNLCLKTEMSKN